MKKTIDESTHLKDAEKRAALELQRKSFKIEQRKLQLIIVGRAVIAHCFEST